MILAMRRLEACILVHPVQQLPCMLYLQRSITDKDWTYHAPWYSPITNNKMYATRSTGSSQVLLRHLRPVTRDTTSSVMRMHAQLPRATLWKSTAVSSLDSCSISKLQRYKIRNEASWVRSDAGKVCKSHTMGLLVPPICCDAQVAFRRGEKCSRGQR